VSDVGLNFRIEVDANYRAYERGFLEGSNPAAYKRLFSFATLNAARTYSKPIKAAAPKGKTGNLIRGVKAKTGRYNRPSAVVGPLYSSRGSTKNPWYRYFVTAGRSGTRRTKNGTFTVKPVGARPFVNDTVKRQENEQRALDAFYKTLEEFYNNQVFKGRILKFRRGSQVGGAVGSVGQFFRSVAKTI
jgi:hypothetical protein